MNNSEGMIRYRDNGKHRYSCTTEERRDRKWKWEGDGMAFIPLALCQPSRFAVPPSPLPRFIPFPPCLYHSHHSLPDVSVLDSAVLISLSVSSLLPSFPGSFPPLFPSFTPSFLTPFLPLLPPLSTCSLLLFSVPHPLDFPSPCCYDIS